MNRVVFYSWQSDLPNATNRSLIQQALENVAKAIRVDDTVGIEPVIDRDTQGVAGAPDIAKTIFQKITLADVVVADVSIITGSRKGRPTPNPNVLIELGYALHALGDERVVLVFNTAYGKVEQLPFDLKMRRSVTYNMPKTATDRATERKALEAKLNVALRAALASPPPPSPHIIENAQQRWTQAHAAANELLLIHAQGFGPKLRISVGPRLPHHQVATREALLDFVNSTASQSGLFVNPPIRSHQGGIFCCQNAVQPRYSILMNPSDEPTSNFINFDKYGIIIARIELQEGQHSPGFGPTGSPEPNATSYYFWQVVPHMRRILAWAADFYRLFSVHTDLLVRLSLEDLLGHPFLLVPRPQRTHEAIAPQILTDELQCPSGFLGQRTQSLIIDACCELLWNFGAGSENQLSKNQIEQVLKLPALR